MKEILFLLFMITVGFGLSNTSAQSEIFIETDYDSFEQGQAIVITGNAETEGVSIQVMEKGIPVFSGPRPELAIRSLLPSPFTSPVIRQWVPRIMSSTVRYFHGSPEKGSSGHSSQNTVLFEPTKSSSPSPSTSRRQEWIQLSRGRLRESPVLN